MDKLLVRAVLFDLDGTITRPILDFAAIRSEIGIEDGTPVLEYLEGLGEADRDRAEAILDAHEEQAARDAEPNDGIMELFSFLKEAGLPTGIVTRNSRNAAEITLEKLGLEVEAVVCRNDAPVKPAPDPVLLAARLVGVAPENGLYVGDYEFDVRAGLAAGMRTVLIPSRPPGPTMPKPDYEFSSAEELIPVIRSLNGDR